MDSKSVYDIAYDAVSTFYWESYEVWMPLLLGLLLWAPTVIGYRYFGRVNQRISDDIGDTGIYTIVALPPRDKLAFPEFCVGCRKATAPDAFVTVSAGIGAGVAQEFAASPGTVVGHSVTWNLPSCTDCATNNTRSGNPTIGLADIFILAALLVWLAIVVVGFALVIGAMDWLQLFWLLPTATILLAAMGLPAVWLTELASRHWSRFRGTGQNPIRFKNPLPSVFFRIEKVEHLPGGMPQRALPWGPHVYRFVFEHREYADRFNELNGGIVAPFDSAGRSKVGEQFRIRDHGPGLRQFGMSFAAAFLIVLVLATVISLFGAFRLGSLYSAHGLGVVALISAGLALGYILGPDDSAKTQN